MKLHAFYGKVSMAKPHNDPVGRGRRNFKRIRQSFALYDQRMVARGFESIWQAAKYCLRIVTYLTGLSVHQVGRALDHSAERFANCLMAEAHSEYRYLPGECANRINCYPRARRHAGARRY